MSDYGELYLGSFVEIIDSMAKAKNFKKGEFAARVWPEISLLVVTKKWRYMITKSHFIWHPQGVLLSDALRMTEVQETDLPYVLPGTKNLADEKVEVSQKPIKKKTQKAKAKQPLIAQLQSHIFQ